ncbi:MAG: hypothetical protein HRT44_01545 [Bdellovibrionales bacterium]|nr:hypothetical protein [Bdellovibrionales bacterium]NQZ17930.1 hypothetical protein [Bdellovibrionales bacterium]
MKMRRRGYSFVCPTSLNRHTKQWNPTSSSNNPDIVNVDRLLNLFGANPHLPIFVVGHSNGGAMATCYYLFSKQRRHKITAAHISSSAGLVEGVSSPRYQIPTYFSYGQCDRVANPRKIESSVSILKRRGIFTIGRKMDSMYHRQSSRTCHEFLDTSGCADWFFDLAPHF